MKIDRQLSVDGFLAPRTCALLTEEIGAAWFWPSTVVQRAADGTRMVGTSPARRSETTGEEWFGSRALRALRRVEARACALLGVSLDHLDAWQAVRYRTGGRFDAHHDGGQFGDEPAGERVATILIYLTTPYRGGATRFDRLGVSVAARAGRLLAWRNLDAAGAPDPDVQHASTPVRGTKLILTTWVRERPVTTTPEEAP